MKLYIKTLALIILVSSVAEASFTRNSCKKLDGVMVNKLECPMTDTVREKEEFCILSNQPLVYFNGCSKSVGDYDKIFYKVCLKHDFCYHHEPATNGLSKKDCDKNFYEDMLKVCETDKSYTGFLPCKTIAWGFYRAVRAAGKKSWECSNSVFDYSDLDKVFADFK